MNITMQIKVMKVGDVYRVFEVNEGYYYQECIGKWACEADGDYYGNKFGVDLFIHAPLLHGNLPHVGLGERNQATLKGRLIIKSLK